MAHFAKLGTGNIVTSVHVVSNDIATDEQAGIEFLQNLYNMQVLVLNMTKLEMLLYHHNPKHLGY